MENTFIHYTSPQMPQITASFERYLIRHKHFSDLLAYYEKGSFLRPVPIRQGTNYNFIERHVGMVSGRGLSDQRLVITSTENFTTLPSVCIECQY